MTSSGVIGEPSWNLIPWRSLKVADLKSGATSYDSARLGENGLPGMCLTSASCIASWKLYGVIWGGFSWGSFQAGESEVFQPSMNLPFGPGWATAGAVVGAACATGAAVAAGCTAGAAAAGAAVACEAAAGAEVAIASRVRT